MLKLLELIKNKQDNWNGTLFLPCLFFIDFLDSKAPEARGLSISTMVLLETGLLEDKCSTSYGTFTIGLHFC